MVITSIWKMMLLINNFAQEQSLADDLLVQVYLISSSSLNRYYLFNLHYSHYNYISLLGFHMNSIFDYYVYFLHNFMPNFDNLFDFYLFQFILQFDLQKLVNFSFGMDFNLMLYISVKVYCLHSFDKCKNYFYVMLCFLSSLISQMMKFM